MSKLHTSIDETIQECATVTALKLDTPYLSVTYSNGRVKVIDLSPAIPTAAMMKGVVPVVVTPAPPTTTPAPIPDSSALRLVLVDNPRIKVLETDSTGFPTSVECDDLGNASYDLLQFRAYQGQNEVTRKLAITYPYIKDTWFTFDDGTPAPFLDIDTFGEDNPTETTLGGICSIAAVCYNWSKVDGYSRIIAPGTSKTIVLKLPYNGTVNNFRIKFAVRVST